MWSLENGGGEGVKNTSQSIEKYRKGRRGIRLK